MRASEVNADHRLVLTLVSTFEAILGKAWGAFLRKESRITKTKGQV